MVLMNKFSEYVWFTTMILCIKNFFMKYYDDMKKNAWMYTFFFTVSCHVAGDIVFLQ